MIGQMQGKFQMDVIPGVGHMLHEVRNDFSPLAPATMLNVIFF
jgi:hypothetical protein